MSAPARPAPAWRRPAEITRLNLRIRMSENDLRGAIDANGENSAEATTIRERLQGDRQRLTELQSEPAPQVPTQIPPHDQQAPVVQGETQLPNVEDNPGTREEVEPLAVVQPQIQVVDVEDPVESLQQTQPLTQIQRAIQTLQQMNEDSEGAAQVRDLLSTIENDQLNTAIPTPTILNKTLKEYQKQGFNWMVNKENNDVRKGGILADEMGLGKTIQAISTILAHGSMNWNRATTLIVVPKSLFNQWKSEIITDVKLGQRCGPLHQQFTFKRFYKETRRPDFRILACYSVVLTTYGTIADQLKRREAWESKLLAHPDAEPHGNEDYYPLIGSSDGTDSTWYRVILDESHTIKNRTSLNFRACMALKSTYRWCLSGTPMMNQLNELQPQIEFLRIAPYNNGSTFGNAFTKPMNGENEYNRRAAVRKLHAFLYTVVLRRTSESLINGEPILMLPELTTLNHTLQFSPPEMEFYSAIETQTSLVFNRYLEDRSVSRVYAHVFERLLRLRQAAIHPLLIKNHAQPGVRAPPRSASDSTDPLQSCKELEPRVVEMLKAKAGDFFCPVHREDLADPLFFFACGHEHCAECPEMFPVLWPNNTPPTCFTCRAVISLPKTFTWAAFKEVHMAEAVEDAAEALPEIQDDRFERWHTAAGQVLLSAKTKKCARLLLDIRDRGDGEKSLVL